MGNSEEDRFPFLFLDSYEFWLQNKQYHILDKDPEHINLLGNSAPTLEVFPLS
jgi:hypothetical protein